MKAVTLDEGADRLHRLTKELIRRYQFRDWNQICCYGISISQSHILDTSGGGGRSRRCSNWPSECSSPSAP